MANHTSAGLNTETTIALSQSMDSVNTTPEEEVRMFYFTPPLQFRTSGIFRTLLSEFFCPHLLVSVIPAREVRVGGVFTRSVER